MCCEDCDSNPLELIINQLLDRNEALAKQLGKATDEAYEALTKVKTLSDLLSDREEELRQLDDEEVATPKTK